jgi:hypothetical protein
VNSTIVGLAAFASTCTAALLAITIRGLLPTHHLEGNSKEFVNLVLGLIATLTALVLGLLISSAHSAFEAQENELQQLGIHIFQIDRNLANFGPETQELRALLKHMISTDIDRVWSKDGRAPPAYASIEAQQEGERLFEGVENLAPKTDVQRWDQSRTLHLLEGVGETRRLLVEQSRHTLGWPILAVLVSWLTVLFFGFGLFARFNATVLVALLIGSASVAGAVFLILEMNQPYGGWMRLSSAPLLEALTQMGH